MREKTYIRNSATEVAFIETSGDYWHLYHRVIGVGTYGETIRGTVDQAKARLNKIIDSGIARRVAVYGEDYENESHESFGTFCGAAGLRG